MNETEETHHIRMENRIRLTIALRTISGEVLTGDLYGIARDELISITKPLSELITRLIKEE